MSWGNKMYEAESVGVLTAGTYEAVVAKVEQREHNGTTYINVQFKAQSGSIFDKFYTQHANPKAVSAGYGRMKQLAIACGWKPDDQRKTLVRGHEEFSDPRCLIGEKVTITVTENESNGKTYSNVSGFKPVGFGGNGGQTSYATQADDLGDGSTPFTGQF